MRTALFSDFNPPNFEVKIHGRDEQWGWVYWYCVWDKVEKLRIGCQARKLSYFLTSRENCHAFIDEQLPHRVKSERRRLGTKLYKLAKAIEAATSDLWETYWVIK